MDGDFYYCNFSFFFEQLRIKFRLCSKHRKSISVTEDIQSTAAESHFTSGTQFVIEDTRDTMNRILDEANISPIRSQTKTALKHQSKGSLRRLLSKLKRGTSSLQGMSGINFLHTLRIIEFHSRKIC